MERGDQGLFEYEIILSKKNKRSIRTKAANVILEDLGKPFRRKKLLHEPTLLPICPLPMYVNRPGVAGAVLQSPPHLFID